MSSDAAQLLHIICPCLCLGCHLLNVVWLLASQISISSGAVLCHFFASVGMSAAFQNEGRHVQKNRLGGALHLGCLVRARLS